MIFFFVIWFAVCGMIFAFGEFDFFPVVFTIIGIVIVGLQISVEKMNQNSLKYIKERDYTGFVSYAEIGLTKRAPALLLAGAFVAFYMTRENEKAKQFILEALKQSPPHFSMVSKYFSYIVKTLNLKEEIKKAHQTTYGDNQEEK